MVITEKRKKMAGMTNERRFWIRHESVRHTNSAEMAACQQAVSTGNKGGVSGISHRSLQHAGRSGAQGLQIELSGGWNIIFFNLVIKRTSTYSEHFHGFRFILRCFF